MALLGEDEIEQRLQSVPHWTHDGDAITRDFECGDFKGSVDFVNRVLPVAEAMGHHPDLEISWDTVSVRVTSHSEGGLTAADFDLAARLDALG